MYITHECLILTGTKKSATRKSSTEERTRDRIVNMSTKLQCHATGEKGN